MPCPTCDHTLSQICTAPFVTTTLTAFHCQRCGTVVVEFGDGSNRNVYRPKLVDRCREFEAEQVGNVDDSDSSCIHQDWHRLGIAESIHRPEDRKGA